MNIVVGDVWASIQEPKKHARALAIVRDLCRARPDGYVFMPKFKSGRWDGYISLMKGMNKFPSGFETFVVGALLKKGIEFTLHKKMQLPWVAATKYDLNGIAFRDYQLNAINSMLLVGRGIAKMATNSGKTEVMAGIIKALGIPKTVVVLHRKELLHQTADRFEKRLGIEVGRIGDGVWDVKTVTVAMVQTLSIRGIKGDPFKGNELVMIDECHHASSDQMMDVLYEIPGGYRFGFSGTPLKYDALSDMKLIGMTGGVIVDVSNEYLVDEGFSAKPIVEIHTIESNDEDDWELKYQDAYSKLVVNNAERNQIIADFANTFRGLVLVLVDRIEHGNILSRLTFGSTFVSGSDSSKHRQQVLDDMRVSNRGIVIASPIFNEGVDVPSVDAVVIAGGGVSHVNLLQKIGRGMRAKGGDNTLTILDFIDDTNMYLLEHSDGRISTYVREGFQTKLIEQTNAGEVV